VKITFDGFERVTRNMTLQRRLELFLALDTSVQEAMWANLQRDRLALRIREQQEWEFETCRREDAPQSLKAIRRSLEPPPESPPFMEHLNRSIDKRQALDEQLLQVPAADYIEKIARVPVDRKYIYCPLPDHDDTNTPNFYVYEFNWRCYACGAQGRIYQFAALMWGYSLPLRGRAFNEVFERLCSTFRLDA
jgi:hypothetical protein